MVLVEVWVSGGSDKLLVNIIGLGTIYSMRAKPKKSQLRTAGSSHNLGDEIVHGNCCGLPSEKGAKPPLSSMSSGSEYHLSGMKS